MKWSLYFLIAGWIALSNTTVAQCFQIESILVDACGNQEGENEMVRLKIGNQAINISDFVDVDWPTAANPFQGFVSNTPETTPKVDLMNASTTSCGSFIEPVGGAIPANSTVLIITSTNFNPANHDFSGLQEDIYVIFQEAGNTSGHFANYNSDPGLRTLEIHTPGCSQSVTYERSNLITQSGVPGAEDGARVDFDASGNPTYLNEGCKMPYEGVDFELNFAAGHGGVICPSQTVDVIASISGTPISYEWESDFGSFDNPNDLTPTYTPNGDATNHYIYFNMETSCSDPLSDSLLIQINELPICSIGLIDSLIICAGDQAELNYPSTNDIVWNTGETTQTIFVDSEGYYTITASNSCGSCIDSFYVHVQNPTPSFNLSTYYGKAPLLVNVEDYTTSPDDTWYMNGVEIPFSSTFILDEEGTFDFTLEVGCSNQLTQTVVVEGIDSTDFQEAGNLKIPNVFTPNGDNENDHFQLIDVQNIETIEIEILNRWGNIVFTSEDTNFQWNGQINNDGTECTDGTYFYKINFTDSNGKENMQHGFVQLSR